MIQCIPDYRVTAFALQCTVYQTILSNHAPPAYTVDSLLYHSSDKKTLASSTSSAPHVSFAFPSAVLIRPGALYIIYAPHESSEVADISLTTLLTSSSIRQLYPHSLSYHTYSFTRVPSVTIVEPASTTPDRASFV